MSAAMALAQENDEQQSQDFTTPTRSNFNSSMVTALSGFPNTNSNKAPIPMNNSSLSESPSLTPLSSATSSPARPKTIVPHWQMRIIKSQASLRCIQAPNESANKNTSANNTDNSNNNNSSNSSRSHSVTYPSSASSEPLVAGSFGGFDHYSSNSSTAASTPAVTTPSSTGPTSFVVNPSSSRNSFVETLTKPADLIATTATTISATTLSSPNNNNSSTNNNAVTTTSSNNVAQSTSTPPLLYEPDPEPEEELIPPENFSMVSSHIYRSSFPRKKNLPYLASLGLKSVVSLVLEEYPGHNLKFYSEHGMKFFQFGIPGNKEPFIQIPEDIITDALVTMLDTRNYPMLIHCNKGKHRTGCLIGCFRKLQNWAATSIFDEYLRFAYPKARSMDQQFIELFDTRLVWSSVDQHYLPSWVQGHGI